DDISDYVASNIKDSISRLNGVGDVQLFGAQYAMRIWLDANLLLENSRHEDQNWRDNLVRQVQHSELELVANFADIPLRLSQILKL
ncbi:efflux RND transporter permease subunit, partial [Salmonella enterica subsp. enterica serovar Cerro]|nr:efflux RND transporter permease subunit [Salmonella enterica subsp. enterica serovar Cerro]